MAVGRVNVSGKGLKGMVSEAVLIRVNEYNIGTDAELIGVGDDGSVYVTEKRGKLIKFSSDFSEIAEITPGSGDYTGDHIIVINEYILYGLSSLLYKSNANNLTVIDKVDVGGIVSLAYSQGYCYVSNHNKRLLKIHVGDMSIIQQRTLDNVAHGLHVDGGSLYCSIEDTGEIWELDTSDLTEIQRRRIGTKNANSIVSDDNFIYCSGIWVEGKAGYLHKLNKNNLSEVASSRVVSAVNNYNTGVLVIDNEAEYVYVVSQGPWSVNNLHKRYASNLGHVTSDMYSSSSGSRFRSLAIKNDFVYTTGTRYGSTVIKYAVRVLRRPH